MNEDLKEHWLSLFIRFCRCLLESKVYIRYMCVMCCTEGEHSMFDEFIERYAGLLSGRDVSELFDRLSKILGSIAEAARVCDIERRTPYYWRPDEGPEVKLLTKKKVLKALIDRDFERTLKFMIERSVDASRDMLRMYLGTIYEKAMNPEIPTGDFQPLLNEFRTLRVSFSGLVDSGLAEELSDMFMNLKGEAENRDVDFPPLPLSTMTAQEVVHYLPRLSGLVPRDVEDVTLDSLSRELNFPEELVKLASDLAPPSPLSMGRPITDQIKIARKEEMSEMQPGEKIIRIVVDKRYEELPLKELADAPVAAISGISEGDAALLKTAFGIDTVRELAENKYVKLAQAIVAMGPIREH